jgi:hypothetical protein
MGAFIVSPTSGDKVARPVSVVVDYTFTGPTVLTCNVGADHDAGTSLNGSGRHTGSVGTVLTGPQQVSAKDGATVLSFQNNVTILNSTTAPIVIISVPEEVTGAGETVALIGGICDPGTLPENPFVACILYSINPGNLVRTPVTIGFAVPDPETNQWKLTLKFVRRPNFKYVARAFLVDYSDPFTIVSATTKPVGG